MNHQSAPQRTARPGATGERAVFAKIMSDPVPIPEAGIDRAVEILRGGRPFRYGEDTGGQGEASLLERDIARYTGRAYGVAVNSCGCSLFLALKSLGVEPGDQVLCNAFTLAPVPGAIAHAAARPVMVDITAWLTIDLDDLRAKIASSGAKVLLLSQMRGHMPDMPVLMEICDAAGVDVIEDCAHTLGARFAGRLAGTFGRIGCYSAQTFKHMNAGEGGLIVTDDAEVAARAILMSGSYMMYHQNGARPELEVFEPLRDETPNFSMRMTDTAAALLRPQLAELEGWTARWNASYRRLEAGLGRISGLSPIARDKREDFVGSSIQFTVEDRSADAIAGFVEEAGRHGVFLKWFGAARTVGFTSRFDQWGYAEPAARLPSAAGVLSRLIDMRVALSFEPGDCDTILQVLDEAMEATVPLPDASA